MGYQFKYFLFLFWTVAFTNIYGQIKKDFRVLEFAVDGLKTNPISFATLIEHEPRIPFPDVFTLCWRSRTSFAHEFWGWNYIEIPFKPGERFMGLYLKDNATHSIIAGRK